MPSTHQDNPNHLGGAKSPSSPESLDPDAECGPSGSVPGHRIDVQ